MRVRVGFAVLVLSVAGCRDVPSPLAANPGERDPRRAVGLIELTISGVGSAQPVATARVLPVSASGGAAPGLLLRRAGLALTDRALTILPGDGTVQLEPVSSGSFVTGNRGSGGYRYVTATYRVRNATSAGTPNVDARTNLTLVAVNESPATISGTAISRMDRYDGMPAAAAIALDLVPTGLTTIDGTGAQVSLSPDVLQFFTESEVGDIDLEAFPTIQSVLPYGFVVRRNPAAGSRALPANPATGQFDGVVTVAFKFPLQATAAADPFTISARFLAVDDHQPWVTQSYEESRPVDDTLVAQRATALGASVRTVLDPDVATMAGSTFCQIRLAGTAASPTAFILDSVGVLSLTPSGLASGVVSLAATFDHVMVGGSISSAFVVTGFQGGRKLVGESYAGGGTNTLVTPTAPFHAGERFEVSLTPALAASAARTRICNPRTYQFVTATTPPTASIVLSPDGLIPTGAGPTAAALGDINGDGSLDLAVANGGGGDVSLYAGDGAGHFTGMGSVWIGSGYQPKAIAFGELNEDGHLDLAVAYYYGTVAFMGDGAGGFTTVPGSTLPIGSDHVSLADLNGDGHLDVIAARSQAITTALGDGRGGFHLPVSAERTAPFGIGKSDVGDVNQDGRLDVVTPYYDAHINVSLGDGGGRFTDAPTITLPPGTNPEAVALADFNGDGKLDIASANSTPASVSVFLGDGTGGFAPAPGSPIPVGGFVVRLTAGDLNGDGYADLAIPDYFEPMTRMLLGSSDGSMTSGPGSPLVTHPGALSGTPFVAFGDVDTDGTLDLVALNWGTNSMAVMLNK